jgi:hypothetical protein
MIYRQGKPPIQDTIDSLALVSRYFPFQDYESFFLLIVRVLTKHVILFNMHIILKLRSVGLLNMHTFGRNNKFKIILESF